jgi:predicted aldo/keto reductase-like oxidoreductase
MTASWDKRTLGRTGLQVSAIGLGSSFGLATRDVERAYERGINYMYWGSMRRRAFGNGVRNIAKRDREGMVVVVQSYSRSKLAMAPSVHSALRRLELDYADVLLLGWWNQMPPNRILDAALTLKEAGKVNHIMISCHHRPSFESYIADPVFGAIMVRYNAAHRGAEREVFPFIDASDEPPGVCSYTATRWGALLDPQMVPEGEATPRASDCYRFALANEHVNMCLSGPKDAKELDEAMAALDRGPMDEDELAWMRRVGDGVHKAAGLKAARSPAQILDRVASAIYRRRP